MYVGLSCYLFEAHFEVVLRLLLVIRERFINQQLLLYMDLENKKYLLQLRTASIASLSTKNNNNKNKLTSKYGLVRLWPSDTKETSLTHGISP